MALRCLWVALLLATAAGDCAQELVQVMSKFLTVLPTDVYGRMAAASGKWLNDLGDYPTCSLLPGAEYALVSLKLEGVFIGVGLCGPQSCTADDYFSLLDKLKSPWADSHPVATLFAHVNDPRAAYDHLVAAERQEVAEDVKVEIVFPRREKPAMSTGAVVMTMLCVLLSLCVATGTALEVCYIPSARTAPRPQKAGIELKEMRESLNPQVEKPQADTAKSAVYPAWIRAFMCFSLATNLPRLFSVSEREAKDSLFALNGLRVLSMVWIFLGHVIIFGLRGTVFKNPQDIIPYFTQDKTALIFSAHFAVDTFLWLTGLLMAFVILQKAQTQAPSLTALYLHRAIRILPTYAFILFLTWTLTVHFTQGPLAYKVVGVDDECKETWWTNLLFIHNVYPDRAGMGCLGQSWYLSVDTQLYLAGVPLVLLYHWRDRRYGWLGAAALSGISVVASAYLVWTNDFGLLPTTPGNLQNHFVTRYYILPYTRAAPFALGLACAFIVHSARVHKATGNAYDPLALTVASLLERRAVRTTVLIAGVSLGLFIMFVQNDAFQALKDPSLAWSRGENTLFLSTARLAWAVSVSAVMVPVMLGFNPACRWVLSWSVWAPLAKLTFCVYLIHGHIIFAYHYSEEAARWFGDLEIARDLCFTVPLSLLLSVPIVLAVELPAQALARSFLKLS